MGASTWGGLKANITVPKLTELVRMEAQEIQGIAQIATPPTGQALGLQAGEERQYTYVPELDETQGGELDENTPIPTDGVDPIKESYKVKEYGHGIAFTGLLESLSELDMDDIHMKSLDAHRRKLENTLTYDQLKATDWKYVFDATPTAADNEFVKDGTPTKNTDNGDLSLRNLSLLRTKAKKEKIPFWDGESYIYITGADSIEALESDGDLTNLLKEDSGRAALNGEMGRIKQCRLVEDNHKTAQHPKNFDEGFLVGADAVVNESALPVEMRFEVTEMGRSKKLAYYFIAAWFKLIDQTKHSQEHIIHVTAAS
jgi:hypothetical protein